MDNRPIGVFDSGVGGLTAVRELRSLLPNEDIIYFGDTGRIPYGTRSNHTIKKYARQDIRYMQAQNVKAIVAACGTVSTNLTRGDVAALSLSIPYTGVLEPVSETACRLSDSGRIGVIATPASIKTGAYGRVLREMRPDAQVFEVACPLFVSLVENGMIERTNEITRLTARMYLEPLAQNKIDTLILGCTHYPLIYDIINDILAYKVTLVDSGAAAARHIKDTLAARDALADRAAAGSAEFHVTDTVDNFADVAQYFLHEDIGPFTRFVDLDSLDR